MSDQPPHAPPVSGADEEREKAKNIGALRALWPFVRPYRVLMGAAIAALVVTRRYFVDVATCRTPGGR